MAEQGTLTDRKRLQGRARIVRAADDLFHESGFDAVSVSDIASRAEVGRTTFFRYFGDKQEVVFAQEEELIATITDEHRRADAAPARSLSEAVAQLQDLVLALCVQVTHDPSAYTRHYELVDSHPELQARDALKMRRFTGLLRDILVDRGTDAGTAELAAQVAHACFEAAKNNGSRDPRTLPADAEAAFERCLNLGSDPDQRRHAVRS